MDENVDDEKHGMHLQQQWIQQNGEMQRGKKQPKVMLRSYEELKSRKMKWHEQNILCG